MPIYEYRCKECEKVSEILVGVVVKDEAIVCQHCGSTNLEKLLSASVGFIRESSFPKGATCCGRETRCDTPPCSDDGVCRRG